MKFARLLIAAAVLAGLGGLLYWSNRTEEAKVGKADPKAAPKILDLKETEIKQIEIRHRDGETTVLQRDGSGKWTITAPQPLAADQSAASALATAASTLSSERVVDENASNLPSYGLEPARIGITLTMTDGKTHLLRIGEDTPMSRAAVALRAVEPRRAARWAGLESASVPFLPPALRGRSGRSATTTTTPILSSVLIVMRQPCRRYFPNSSALHGVSRGPAAARTCFTISAEMAPALPPKSFRT
jgi:hypothetical protein